MHGDGKEGEESTPSTIAASAFNTKQAIRRQINFLGDEPSSSFSSINPEPGSRNHGISLIMEDDPTTPTIRTEKRTTLIDLTWREEKVRREEEVIGALRARLDM